MKKLIAALLATTAILAVAPAQAGDIGGGIAFGNMNSFAGGATASGNIAAQGVLGNGVLSGHLTHSAHSDQIAGTTSTLTKLPNGMQAQIVSEYAGNSWTQTSANLISVNSAGMVSLGGGVALGAALSSGNQTFLTGYVNW